MPQPRIGLALGGGGARGLAHIPVLQALDDLGIKPVAITGSSIGAIIGSAYASGLSGQQIHDIVLEKLGDRNAVLSHLWKLRPRKLTELFEGNLVQFDPLKILMAFTGEYMPETFEDLRIPLTVVSTDFYGTSEFCFSEGPLLHAISASIAIPAVFKPVKHNGMVLIDGGVTNPLPFDHLPTDCDLIIAVDVVGAPVKKSNRQVPTSLDAIFGSSQILMQTITTQKLKQQQPDILVRPADDNIRVLDFLKSRKILEHAAPLRHDVAERITNKISNL